MNPIRLKFLALFCFLSVSFMLEAQEKPLLPIDENTELITYRNVVQMEGTPAQLYDRALAWVNKYFKNPSQVIKVQDKEKSIIECSSNIKITNLSKDGKTNLQVGLVYYKLLLELREGRYRYTITEFNSRTAVNQPIEIWFDTSKAEWSPQRYEHLRQVDEGAKQLMKDLEKGMEPPKVIVDEW